MRFAKLFNTKKLKKQLLKKGAVLGAVGLLAVACSGTTIMAKPTASGSLDGFACYGKVSTDEDSATAITTCGRGNINIKATATVYYWFGDKYYNSIMYHSNSNSSSSATAKKNKGGAQVIGGKGEHHVSFNSDNVSHNWDGTTTIGTIPSKSTTI